MSFQNYKWNLDVSALMIMVGEDQEAKYRMVRRSALEWFNPAPVVGMQGFLRHPNHLPKQSEYVYVSPGAQKMAPLRNWRLAYAIEQLDLLEEPRYTVLRIPPKPKTKVGPNQIRLHLWFLTCFCAVFGLIGTLFTLKSTTWIGQSTCIVLVGWSIVLRVVEGMLTSSPVQLSHVTDPTMPDAVYILGQSNSGLVLEGSRVDIKRWTAQSMHRYPSLDTMSCLGRYVVKTWIFLSRAVSLLVLLLIFTTIPNGTTIDQIIFTAINVLGQANVMLGQSLNGACLLSELEVVENDEVSSRTALYAKILRRFSANADELDWSRKVDLLPRHDTWSRWAERIVQERDADTKRVYDQLHAKYIASGTARGQDRNPDNSGVTSTSESSAPSEGRS